MNKVNYVDEIRKEILDIEGKIKTILQNYDKSQGKWYENENLSNLIMNLLSPRKRLLNEMFLPSNDNLERLKKVNEHLYLLTLKLHERVNKVVATKSHWFGDIDFDDSYNLEGTLHFVYNDNDSILKLNDDNYYGSDFRRMIEIINEYHTKRTSYIETVHPGILPLDDGASWKEYPFHNKAFDDIIICHAVHALCDHQFYSIPDLLRLNDFWAEVKIEIQSITNQNGYRFKD